LTDQQQGERALRIHLSVYMDARCRVLPGTAVYGGGRKLATLVE
jgi:hypothetical protein